MMNSIRVENVSFSYGTNTVLNNVTFSIDPGTFNVLIGPNGSGKSTLAKIIASLLKPDKGTITNSNITGIVFQNPDNQIVADTVEDDAAFAPENMGLPQEEIERRVSMSLAATNLLDKRHAKVSSLSGGQKVLLSVAGILAMEPEIIVLDEPTSMLDPAAANSILSHLRKLNKEQHKTIILITQNSSECIGADNVILFAEGQIKKTGTSEEVFREAEAIAAIGLELPPVTQLALRLKKKGILKTDRTILTADSLAQELKKND